jgi:hypothetical protein
MSAIEDEFNFIQMQLTGLTEGRFVGNLVGDFVGDFVCCAHDTCHE